MRLPDIPEHFWLCDVPGTDTFDADGPLSLGALHDVMEAERLLEVFCHDGIPSRDAFIELFDRDERWTYAAFREDGAPLVMAVVSGVTGKSGLAHFCFMRAGFPLAARLAREWLLPALCGIRGIPPRGHRARRLRAGRAWGQGVRRCPDNTQT